MGLTQAEMESALGPVQALPELREEDLELQDARWVHRDWLARALPGEQSCIFLFLLLLLLPSTDFSRDLRLAADARIYTQAGRPNVRHCVKVQRAPPGKASSRCQATSP